MSTKRQQFGCENFYNSSSVSSEWTNWVNVHRRKNCSVVWAVERQGHLHKVEKAAKKQSKTKTHLSIATWDNIITWFAKKKEKKKKMVHFVRSWPHGFTAALHLLPACKGFSSFIFILFRFSFGSVCKWTHQNYYYWAENRSISLRSINWNLL